MRDPDWRNASTEEFNAQIKNRTWDLVPPHPSQNVIGCRWIFTTKLLPDGILDRYKSRLVGKGYNQQQGVDFDDTFSPVVKSTTIRLVLGVAESKQWPLRQLDVNHAFLQAKLTDEVFMQQPPGFVNKDKPNHACRLNKAIYGLKQAPRAWYHELKQYLLHQGFKSSMADTSLFILRQGAHIVYLLVYVDDIVITGSSTDLVNKVTNSLSLRFSLKDLGNLHYFLGIEVTRTTQGLHLMQRKYTVDLLNRYNMLDSKPVSTPMATTPKINLHTGEIMKNPTQFRQLVGGLQYLAFTRPDIAFSVNRLSQFMHQPTDAHWSAVKRVLRYLSGTLIHGILLRRNNPLSLHAFSDADWAGNSDDFISTNAYIIYLGGHPVSWSSRKQKGVARSSTKAEYRSVANTAVEPRWVCNLLTEMGIRIPHTPVIYCDNVGATYLCANPVFHTRMKHIALDYHFVREQVKNRSYTSGARND